MQQSDVFSYVKKNIHIRSRDSNEVTPHFTRVSDAIQSIR